MRILHQGGGKDGRTQMLHGGADHEGFANAIGVACDLIEYNFNTRIGEELARQYGNGSVYGENVTLRLYDRVGHCQEWRTTEEQIGHWEIKLKFV